MRATAKSMFYKIMYAEFSPFNINHTIHILYELQQAGRFWQHTEFTQIDWEIFEKMSTEVFDFSNCWHEWSRSSKLRSKFRLECISHQDMLGKKWLIMFECKPAIEVFLFWQNHISMVLSLRYLSDKTKINACHIHKTNEFWQYTIFFQHQFNIFHHTKFGPSKFINTQMHANVSVVFLH